MVKKREEGVKEDLFGFPREGQDKDKFQDRLIKHSKQLNGLLKDEVAYLCFGYNECGFRPHSFGSSKTMGYSNYWHAYTNNGRVELEETREYSPLRRLKIVEETRIHNANFFERDKKDKFDPEVVSIALAGEHKSKKPWHLFYFIGSTGQGLFDYRVSRDAEFVECRSSLFVLPGMKNIKKLFEIRKEVMEREPEYITEKVCHQESERDHPTYSTVRKRNPRKTDPSDHDIFAKLGYYPSVEELVWGLFFNFRPSLPVEKEFLESLQKISEKSQLSLGFE